MKILKLLIKWVIIINLWFIGLTFAIIILASNIPLFLKILLVVAFLWLYMERRKRKKSVVPLQIITNDKSKNTNTKEQPVATKSDTKTEPLKSETGNYGIIQWTLTSKENDSIEPANEKREKLEFLRNAANAGEIISIKYYGGTRYGIAREIVPRKIEGDKLRAYCCIDNIEKTFFIDKMAILNETGEILYDGQIDITKVIDDSEDTSGLSIETQIKVAIFTIFFIIGVIMSLIGIFSRPVLIVGIASIVISILCCFVKIGTEKK